MRNFDTQFYCPHCNREIDSTKINQWKGAQMGRATSTKKKASSAENGKKGGRPRKQPDMSTDK